MVVPGGALQLVGYAPLVSVQAHWPNSLPDLLLGSFSESPQSELVRDSVSSFIATDQRRRFTAGVKNISASIMVSLSQLTTFEAFYETALGGGSKRFSYADLIEGTVGKFRIIGGYSKSAKSSSLFVVSFQLEKLPQ